MGGAIVQAVAKDNPEWLKANVLIATGPRLAVNPMIIEGLQKEPQKMIGKIAKWAISKSATQEIYQKVLSIFSSAHPEITAKDFKACDTFNGEEYCKNIQKPVLIVAGKDDLMTPPKLSEQLRDLIPHSQLKLIENCGHMIQIEKPKELAAAIMDFLSHL